MSETKLKSIHGKSVYLSDKDRLAAKQGFVAGGDGAPAIVIPGNPNYVAHFEDFHTDQKLIGDTGAGSFWLDTGSAASAHVAGTNGVQRITPTLVDVDDAHSISGRHLAWKPNQGAGAYSGDLRIGARIKKADWGQLAGVRTGYAGIFVGFTDVAGAEMPVHDTGGAAGTITATASNAFGIIHNSNGDTGFVGVGVDGDSLQSTLLGASEQTANTYVTLEAVMHRGQGDTGGTVSFFVDGVAKGYIDNPCNTSTALTPIIAMYDTGGASVVDIDWVAVSALRDTGL
jgi:hypothetical protein